MGKSGARIYFAGGVEMALIFFIFSSILCAVLVTFEFYGLATASAFAAIFCLIYEMSDQIAESVSTITQTNAHNMNLLIQSVDSARNTVSPDSDFRNLQGWFREKAKEGCSVGIFFTSPTDPAGQFEQVTVLEAFSDYIRVRFPDEVELCVPYTSLRFFKEPARKPEVARRPFV